MTGSSAEGELSGPRRRAWESLGLPLVCHTWGDERAPAVVLLHGFLDQGRAFDPVARQLAASFHVIVPDHRGHGESGHVGPGGYYHFPDYALDLGHMLDALGIARAALVGHSMGAAIAAYYAGSFPERATAVVLLDAVGPHHAPPERGPAQLRRWIQSVGVAAGRTTDAGFSTLAEVAAKLRRTAPHATDEQLLAIAPHAVRKDADGRYRWRFDPLHRTPAPIPFDADRFSAFLAAIEVPALVVWGEKSPFRHPAAKERIAHLRDVRQFTLPGTGHNLHHERPDELASLLLGFLTPTIAARAS